MTFPKAYLFDLDDTLAESFKPPERGMIDRLIALLDKAPVAILTAAGFPRVETEFLDFLILSPRIDRFFVFPSSASECYIHRDGAWRIEYSLSFTDDERSAVKKAIADSIAEVGPLDTYNYTSAIIDRDSQVAFAALGLQATVEDKNAWDPNQQKRRRLKAAIESRIPQFEVLIGGKTTIDITKKGVDKAYGVRWLAHKIGCDPSEMLFVGDALYEGGNDAVVIQTGIQTTPVANPGDTASVIDTLLERYEETA